MQYLGDILKNATIRGSFNTRTAAGTPITLGGTPALSVYKDADAAETTTGVTLTVDFDSRTGHHVFSIATTDAFYTTGSDFRVVITTGTVDGVSVVGTEVGSFSIQNRNSRVDVRQIEGQTASAAGAVTFPGTIASTTNITAASGVTLAAVTHTGAVIPTVTTTNTATNLTNLPSIPANWITAAGINSGAFTSAKFAAGAFDAVWTVSTRSLTTFGTLVSDIWSHATRTLTAISDSSGVTTLLSRIIGTLASGTHNPQSGDAFARIGANGAGLTAIGDTRMANLDATVSSRSNLDAVGVRSAVGLASANLDTQLADIPTVAEFEARTLPSADYFVVGDYTAPPSEATIADAVWDEVQSGHTTIGTFGYYLDAQVSAAGGGGLTLGDIADAVWDEAISGHLTAGSTGAALNAAGGSGDPWSTVLPGSYVAGQAGYLLDQIGGKTALITAGEVQFTAMVGSAGRIAKPIMIGDDYIAANGRAFEWSIPARAGYVVGTSTCRFGGVNEDTGAAWNVTGTVSDLGGGQWRLSFDLSKSVTGALVEGYYRWSVELISAGGTEVTEVYSGRNVEVRAKQT